MYVIRPVQYSKISSWVWCHVATQIVTMPHVYLPNILLGHRCDILISFTQYKCLHWMVLTNTDTIEFYIIRMTTNVHEGSEGKSSFGYPTKMLFCWQCCYGKPALCWIFRPDVLGVSRVPGFNAKTWLNNICLLQPNAKHRPTWC